LLKQDLNSLDSTLHYILLFGLLFVLTGVQTASAKSKINMIYTDEYPPFYYKEREKGMYFEFLRAFGEKYPEFDIRRKTLSRKRIDVVLENGGTDAYSMTSTQFNPSNIHPKFIPSDVIWTTSDVLLSAKGSPLSYTKIEDLFNKNIGVIHGNDYMQFNQYFDDKLINRIDAYTTSELLALLVAKRIDGIIINLHGLSEHIKFNGYHLTDFHVSKKSLYSFDLVTLISTEKMDLYRALSQFIQQSKENGLISQLELKYTSGLANGVQAQ